jgi:hypothetical protein
MVVVLFLLVFAVATGLLAIGGAKASKAAKKAKMRQDMEIYKELMNEAGKNKR